MKSLWKNFDRRMGYERHEVLINVTGLWRWWKKRKLNKKLKNELKRRNENGHFTENGSSDFDERD